MTEVPDTMVITGTGAKYAVRLCNFGTGKAFLLNSHTQRLDADVPKAIAGMNKIWVVLKGYASKLGDSDKNLSLSGKRVEATKNWISNYSNKIEFRKEYHLGEKESLGKEDDDSGYYRAVEVLIYANKPPPPKPDPEIVSGSKEFAIKCTGIIGATVPLLHVVQFDSATFKIADLKNELVADFEYSGGSLAPPSLSLSPVSASFGGPWKRFKTTNNMDIGDFAGELHLVADPSSGSIGPSADPSWLGNLNLTFRTKRMREKRALTIPRIIVVNAGSGLAAPSFGSAGAGTLKMLFSPRKLTTGITP